MDKLNRINEIHNHDIFKDSLMKNNAAETDRLFCRHGMVHFLDVARIAMILNLEDRLEIDREWIYAAALLHDIGRYVQYAVGTPHEIASAGLAEKVLKDCGFSGDETGVIIDAILSHRNPAVAQERNLRGILYRADKASRACFSCDAEAKCNWKEKNKNLL